jgi:Flp pilus assembly protein TadG
MPLHPSTRPPRTRRAVSAVECAFLAPFLALFVIGIAEVARAILVSQVLADAVRYGCRTGIQPGNSTADVTTAVNTVLTNNNIPNSPTATITVSVNGSSTTDASTAVAGDQITVQVSIPFSQVSWGIIHYLGGGATLSSTLIMQRQG